MVLAMLMVWLAPSCTQLAPSEEIELVKMLPLRVTLSQ
jgi:hypothetical protein